MSVKKITSITMAILVSQLMGCAAASQSEMLQKINNGDQIQIEIDTPSNQEQGAEQSLDWLPLDQLNTNPELRKAIDELFKIVQESDSKNGVFYVDLEGNQNGNNTLYNTFVNSKFRGYWNDSSVMKQLAEIAFTTYTDVETEGNKYTTATLAALNGYFNLLADAAPSYANMNSTLTRLEAMAALYKAENPVTDSLAGDKAFTQAVDAGNKNPNTIYAANLKEYSYLNIETSSLDNMTANGTITRGEFVYMLVQKYFKADYDKADPKAVSYADVINGGYIASEQKFIEAGEAKKYWQSYELTYALQNPDQGVPERLYKALVVAHEKGIITDTDSRWDEGLTKADFFELLINTYLAIPAVTDSERGLTKDQEVAANGKETNLSENRNTGSGSTNTTGRSTSQSGNGANTTSGSTSASTNTDSRSTSQSGNGANTNSSNTSQSSNSANTNSAAGEVLTDGRIILDPGKLEVKDITSKTLYYKGKEVSELDITNSVPTDLGNYYLKIESSSVPTLYANIKSFNYLEDEARLTAVADLDNFIHYKEVNGKLVEYSDVVVDLPFIKGSTTTRLKSAASFIEEINKDLTGDYKLTSDLDASGLNGSSYLIPGNFTGTIDGNGFTIYNLEKPLVQNLKGGTIKNLTLDSAKITGANGILALEIMNGGRVENVSIKNSSLSFANNDMLGSICKVLTNGTITGCDIINTTISGRFTIGGIAGQINENGTVRDCLVDATLISSSNHGSLGPRVGGVSGWHNGLIEKTYVDVVIQAPAKNGNGGFIGGPNNANTVRIKDSFAATSGNCNTIAGFTAALSNTNNITNLYEFAEAGVSSHGLSYITSVNSKADKGIQDNLNLSDRIWNYVQKKNANLSGGIEKVENYNENAKTAYYNISKLAPYLNSYDIVDAGNRLVDSALKTKRISFIVPFDSANNMIIGLTADTADSIRKIKVVFEDNSYRDFTVTYTELFDQIIAAYKIDGLNLDYHFNKYVCDIDTALKGDMVNLVNSYDYSADLDPITGSADKRQYRDFYQDYLKADLDGFIHNILLSQEEYANCLDNAYFKANVKNELTNNLKEITYGYNYYSKWYDLNFGSINLRDLLFFNGESIDESLTMEYLTEKVCSGSKIHTRETYDFFENNLKSKFGGRDLYETLEMFIDLTGSSDYNKWFDDNFDGILKEQNVIGFTPKTELKYRIWDNMKKLTGINSHLLLLLNIPKEFQPDIIVISAPSQLVLSSVNIYHAESNEVTRNQAKTAADNFAALLGKYYGTSLTFVENGESNLNRDIFINYDTILHFRSTKYPGNQSKDSEEPLVKWVFDAQERLYAGNAGGVANGKYTFYGYITALNQQGFGLFSHENAHNQDSKYFYDNAGRRQYSGGEHHCEGVLTVPEYYDGHLAFNLTREYNFTDYVVTNLSPARIASKELIKDFYKDIFDSWYALNAIYGEAFIGSPSSVKENVSKKVREYRLTDGDPNATSSSTQYAYGYWDYQFDSMNIKTFEQLYDAKVAVRPIYNVASDYYIEEFWNVNWYEPSNPNGIADPGVFKRMAYEMLGYAGYDQGFVTWLSQRSANDDDAIQKITGYSNMREYKLARYNDALSKLSSIPYFDHEQIEEVIKLAYATESRSSTNNSLAIKKILYSAVKRVTADFTDGTIYTKSKTFYEVDNAQDLVRIVNENCGTKGVHITLTDNIDFSNVNAAGETYAGQFVGFINGNGYSITGLEKPMFTNTVYAVISNITLDGDAGSLLANRSTYTLIHDTKYDASKSLAKTKGEVYYEYRINSDLPVVMAMAKPRMTSVSESSLSISENSLAASDSVSENGLGIANENSPTGVSENSLEALTN